MIKTEKSEDYKQIGEYVIPEEWEVQKLANLCETIVDCAHSTPVWTTEGVVVLRNQNIRNGKLDLSAPSYTDEAHFIARTRRATPVPGDLVITREAPMGEVCMIPSGLRCCLGQRMVLLRPNQGKCDRLYLLYGLQSQPVQQFIQVQGGTGSTVSNLRIPLIESLLIPLPPLSEQKAIAQSLSDADAAIAELDRLITKKGNIKQGATQQLLTGKKRLPGFSGEWEENNLGDIVKVIDGDRGANYPSNDELFDNGYCLFLTAKNVTKEGFRFLEGTFITKEKDNLLSKGKLIRNDLILTTRGTVGNIAFFNNSVPFEHIRINSGMVILRNESKYLDTTYLYLVLKSNMQKLGFSGFDATHIASAERSRADIFLSTDDRLLRKAQRNLQAINVAIDNPVQWLMKFTQVEDNTYD